MTTTTSPDEPLALSADERNRFLTALVRQALLNRTIRPFVEEWYQGEDLTRAELDELTNEVKADLAKGLFDGSLHLDLRLDEELSQDELREFTANVVKGIRRTGPAKVEFEGRWVEHTPAYEGTSNEDFYQDALSKLLASPPDYLLPEFGQNADAWWRSVVLNAKRDAIRAENRHERILRHAAFNPESWFSDARMSQSPETTVLRHEQHLENLWRIGRLPKNLSDAAYLCYEGYSIQEIAQAPGISYNAAQLRLQRISSPRIRAVLGL